MPPRLFLVSMAAGLLIRAAFADDPPSPPPPPEAPRPEVPKVTDGGVPTEAAGFSGRIVGVVETISDRKTSLKAKITRSEPATGSSAPQPQSLVGLVVTIATGGTRQPDGKWTHDPTQLAWIAQLKPGQPLDLKVTYSAKFNRLRIAELQPPHPPAGQP